MIAIALAWFKQKAGAAIFSTPVLVALALAAAYGFGWSAGRSGQAAKHAIAIERQKAATAEADLANVNDARERERRDMEALEAENEALEEKVRAYEALSPDPGRRLGDDGVKRLLSIGQ